MSTKPKSAPNCKIGYTCGNACIPKANSCRVAAKAGGARTYAQWLAAKLDAGDDLSPTHKLAATQYVRVAGGPALKAEALEDSRDVDEWKDQADALWGKEVRYPINDELGTTARRSEFWHDQSRQAYIARYILDRANYGLDSQVMTLKNEAGELQSLISTRYDPSEDADEVEGLAISPANAAQRFGLESTPSDLGSTTPGIIAMTLASAVQNAQAQGRSGALTVYLSNDANPAFYREMGFRPTGQQQGTHNAYRLSAEDAQALVNSNRNPENKYTQ